MVSKYDLTALTRVFYGAAPIGKELITELVARFTNIKGFIQGYGLTEMSPVCSIDVTQTHGSSGHLLPNTLGKIVNPESKKTLGVGELGEICINGPQMMLGYHRNQKATDETISPDGYLHTGT
ncbi:hypothetical protein PoB_004849500 [Plakobranchus ocellatus]|uniref:AMP-dependent synthetase/ligase domain-containing protein n=1 Tax=Plakobranchus ocellatus TaxID=259542 RepID=A0AAV4BSA8_9GAST|nr:hypothetical protein PoB_004849500 [Plakobranchus ocellatus]